MNINKLEIHACNNPSPVFKRCILSAVASTSSQGVCQVSWGGGLPKCFQMYKNFSGHIIIFPKIQLFSKFTFSCPENYQYSPENLLQIYLNLPKSALEIYLKFLMSNYQGCGTPPPPPPVSFKQTLSDLLFMYFTSQNIVHHTLENFA